MTTRSGRTDDIASLHIWRDVLRKEMGHMERAASDVSSFSLNPHTLKPVTGKIGSPTRSRATGEVAAARERDVEALKSTIAASTRPPQSKSRRPVTVAQEIGWWHDRAEPEVVRATHKQSDEVAFAEVYVDTFHCGPFAKTQTMAR